MVAALSFGGLCNIITIVYFLGRINDLEGMTKDETKSENKRALFWTTILGLFFLGLALLLSLWFPG